MNKYTKQQLLELDAIDVYKMILKGDVLKRFPAGFWQGPEGEKNSIKCTKYMIENILQYDDEQIIKNLSIKTFQDNKLGGMLSRRYKHSIYNAVEDSYPGRIKPWLFAMVPLKYWNVETGKEAVKWLIEDNLKWNDEDIKNKLTKKVFYDNNLSGMISSVFKNSPYLAINEAFPNKFKPWQFSQVSKGFWNIETGKDSIKWLIEEKLKWNDEDIEKKLNIQIFKDNGLYWMLCDVFNGSIYSAIHKTYPNRFKSDSTIKLKNE